MTPGSRVGFGLGDEQVALDSHGPSKAMTGLPAEAAAQHVARSVTPRCPARGAARTPLLTHRGVRLAAYAASGGVVVIAAARGDRPAPSSCPG
jgi:hypothetical protein